MYGTGCTVSYYLLPILLLSNYDMYVPVCSLVPGTGTRYPVPVPVHTYTTTATTAAATVICLTAAYTTGTMYYCMVLLCMYDVRHLRVFLQKKNSLFKTRIIIIFPRGRWSSVSQSVSQYCKKYSFIIIAAVQQLVWYGSGGTGTTGMVPLPAGTYHTVPYPIPAAQLW